MTPIENSFLLRLKSLLRESCPSALYLGSRVLSKSVLFKKEKRFLAGQREVSSEERSILFLSTIRCGTQLVDSVISEIFASKGGVSLDLGKYHFHSGVKNEGQLLSVKKAEELYPKTGYYFGPLRPIAEGFDYSDYRVINVVRDPRDIMVSYFYSMAYAHTPQNRKYVLDAKEAREKGVEWFVQQSYRLELVGNDLRKILKQTWDLEGAVNFRYEDMMRDYQSFLNQLLALLDISSETEGLFEHFLQKQNELSAKKGSLLGHRRSGKSRQFDEVLEPETVAFLTDQFADLLEGFGYEI